MRFIDLFAGLGGFHLALRNLGHECVFACEIDPRLRELYERNFNFRPTGDIREIPVTQIPAHDIICAGFPCQPFSKAGFQYGFGDVRNGDLFEFVLRIVDHHRPSFVLLENVPNLSRHRSGKTWEELYDALSKRGYDVEAAQLSPHEFGIPQIRERLFIVGSALDQGLRDFRWPEKQEDRTSIAITSILDHNPPDARPLAPRVRQCLAAWQNFLDQFPEDEELPSFPIWSMEFGASYPFKETTPHAMGMEALRAHRGSHGRALAGLADDEILRTLPSHARSAQERFPAWKINFIRQNRELYARHKHWIDSWTPTILEFPSSFQKFEWNCKGEKRDLRRFVLQMRPSGVRVKRPTTAPSLVAMTDTQVPIIAWEERYLTPREGARLQSMDDLKLPESRSKAFEALGNAVNASLVALIAERLIAEPVELEDVG